MSIHPNTRIGTVSLAVSDVKQSVEFYTNIIGLQVLNQDDHVTLGITNTPLIHLQPVEGAIRQPNYTTGLYHVAILVPSRVDLGRVLINLARTQYPLQGFADHYVSEAIYLADPDGNGIEIYADRPRSTWVWNDDTVSMGTDPLDVNDIMRQVPDPQAVFEGMPAGTTIGHIHLKIGDIAQAKRFYHNIVGFDVVTENYPGALFVSAGRYHHHIGLNIWHSRNAPPAPQNSVGLREYQILVPTVEAQTEVIERLTQNDITFSQQDSDYLFEDFWGNVIRLSVDSSS
jgi:catechol 2,3-dioxygenase